MSRKLLAIGCAGMVTIVAPVLAYAYVLPAESILASGARRRADISFSTIVAEGTYQKADGAPVAVWEAIKEGKAHRVERKSAAGTEVTLTVGGKRWSFKLGEKAPAAARYSGDLIFNFYGTADKDAGATRAIQFLESRGVDTNVVSLSRFETRPVYVIGAKPWEPNKPQMWVDKEMLLPVRLIEVDKASGGLTDTRLLGLGSALTGEWYPQRIEVWRDGKLVEATNYTSARLNEDVSEDLFRPPS